MNIAGKEFVTALVEQGRTLLHKLPGQGSHEAESLAMRPDRLLLAGRVVGKQGSCTFLTKMAGRDVAAYDALMAEFKRTGDRGQVVKASYRLTASFMGLGGLQSDPVFAQAKPIIDEAHTALEQLRSKPGYDIAEGAAVRAAALRRIADL